MVDGESRDEWRVIGTSVQGATHERANRPNQDAIRWVPASAVGPPLILAVADGHGSAKSFRSDIGAGLAVDTAIRVVEEFLREQAKPPNLSLAKNLLAERLPRLLVRQWVTAVQKHVQEHPFIAEESAILAQTRGSRVQASVEDDSLIAYGSTLLVALLTSSYIAYLQLGDGDVITVSEKGEVACPVPPDERLFANETTSLSARAAWNDVRVAFHPTAASSPALILLSTDGYSNSFSDESGFLQVGVDILNLMRSDGAKVVDGRLESWLKRTTSEGSGDDITLGVLYRTGAVTVSPNSIAEKRTPSVDHPTLESSTATPDASLTVVSSEESNTREQHAGETAAGDVW
jgi:serine/threonine protein phosphatase PrpC